MWITADVELPEELVAAQQERKLVVFVGSGVSMAAPSSLPDFKGLTRQIVTEAGQPFDEARTDFDVWLGNLKDAFDVPVHRIVQTIIDNPDSAPTSLHRAIAGLFQSAEDVRIVTTNFDRHLTTVVRERFGDDVEIFRAPAFPLGGDFRGLVYLHGSVDQAADRMVLTDDDFGAAYLTDAWAARFLEAMFRGEYTVLFVGYSHSDQVMKYLARGLRRSSGRFSLARAAGGDEWKRLGITLVAYPGTDPEHSALTAAMERWVHVANMGLLEHRQQLVDILQERGATTEDPLDGSGAADPLAIDASTDSYLEATLQDPVRTRFFCDVAKGLRWVPWLEGQDPFLRLFDPQSKFGEVERALANWFAVEVAAEFPLQAISLLQRRGGRFHPDASNAIAFALFRQKPRRPDAIATWAPLLLEDNPRLDPHVVGYLLHGCQWPDEKLLTLALFDHLSTPKVDLRPGLGLFDADPSATYPSVWLDPSLIGEEHQLRDAWDRHFAPHLDEYAIDLSVIATRNLLSCWQRLQLMRPGDSWDALSSKRSAIERHEQDSYPDEVDVLIDVARDVLEHLLTTGDGAGPALLEQWSRLSAGLFRRLVIHGWTERPDKTSDEKLRWLLETEDIVAVYTTKHEVFRLIASCLATASPDVKALVLEAALRPPQLGDDDEPEFSAYVTFNLVAWLTQSAPDFTTAADALAELRVQHPEFGVREHPDLDTWSSSGSAKGVESPMSADELVQSEPAEILELLRTFEGDPHDFLGPDRRGLMSEVSQAVASDFAWSLRLLAQLGEGDEDVELWSAVLGGWRRLAPADAGWTEILDVVESLVRPERWMRRLTGLLADGASDPSTLDGDDLTRAGLLAARLWQVGLNTQDDEAWDVDGARVTWLARATGHWGGELATFWLMSISKFWRSNREAWNGIPPTVRQELETMLAASGHAGIAARTVLASQLNFFLGADEAWTVDHLLPLFDWTKNAAHAEQAWDGYLQRGRWNDHLLGFLMPYFRQSFEQLSGPLAPRRDRFTTFLANIALQSIINPLDWLDEFVSTVEPPTMVAWARTVGRAMHNLGQPVVSEQWPRWIITYWTRRSRGLPRPLTPAEATAMTSWLLAAGDRFSEAAALVQNSSAQTDRQDLFLHRLAEDTNPLAEQHPVELTRVLVNLLANTERPFFGCSDLATIAGRVRAGADPEDFKRLCNEALRLDCSEAPQWLSPGST